MSESIKSRSEMRTLVTDEFRDNHERIFGERKSNRGRWVQDPSSGELVPAEQYVAPHVDERTPVLTDLYMDGLAATDGTDISSRRKRNEYMRRNRLADADDFKGEWAKKEKERDSFRRGEFDRSARREAVGRAIYQAETKRNKRR
jgi:hypothetical protein